MYRRTYVEIEHEPPPVRHMRMTCTCTLLLPQHVHVQLQHDVPCTPSALTLFREAPLHAVYMNSAGMNDAAHRMAIHVVHMLIRCSLLPARVHVHKWYMVCHLISCSSCVRQNLNPAQVQQHHVYGHVHGDVQPDVAQ
jgi:hypothetical protein